MEEEGCGTIGKKAFVYKEICIACEKNKWWSRDPGVAGSICAW